MELDRKTRKALSRLAREAQGLWSQQRDVLSHAKDVARHASQGASDVAKREVLPLALDTYHGTIQPALGKLPWAAAAKVPMKKSRNPFVFVLMAVGTLALAIVGYAAWQTLRADDDLWVEEDDE